MSVLAVAAIGYFAIEGLPNVGKGNGREYVGAAKRYSAEPIGNKDVVLQNTELQQFMQS